MVVPPYDKATLMLDALYDLVGAAEVALEDCNAALESLGSQPANCLAALPTKIEALSVRGGAPSINGRAFDCGTFSLEADQTTALTVPHALGVAPAAVFLYVVDAPTMDEGGDGIQYQFGKFRSHSDENKSFCFVVTTDGRTVALTGQARYRTAWTASTLTFNCDATYPLRAGLTYEWIALGGAQA